MKKLTSLALATLMLFSMFTFTITVQANNELLVRYNVDEIIEAENLIVGSAPNDCLKDYGIAALNAVGGNSGGSIIRNQVNTLNTNAISFNYGAYTSDKDRGSFNFEGDKKNNPPLFDDSGKIYTTEMDFTAQTQGSTTEPVRFWISLQGESSKEIARLEFLKESASNNSDDPVYFVDSEQKPLTDSNQLIFKLRRISSVPGNVGRLKVEFNMEKKTYSAWLGTYDTIDDGKNTATPDFNSVPQMEPLIIDSPFLDQSVTRYRRINLRSYTEEKSPTMTISFFTVEVYGRDISDTDRAETDKNALNVENEITDGDILPTVGDVYNSEITWTSENQGVVIDSNGKITSPRTQEITLTASIDKNGSVVQKEFTLRIIGSMAEIYNGIEFYDDALSTTPATSTQTGTLCLKADIVSAGAVISDAVLLVAQYDGDKLADVITLKEIPLGADDIVNITEEIAVEAGYSLKAFLWKAGNLMPLLDKKELPSG